jgi:predicted transcriptional regulator
VKQHEGGLKEKKWKKKKEKKKEGKSYPFPPFIIHPFKIP